MERVTLLTTEENAAQRLDAYLAVALDATTRSGAVKSLFQCHFICIHDILESSESGNRHEHC